MDMIMPNRYFGSSVRTIAPSCVLSPDSSKPTPTISMDRKAFAPLMMPANSSTGFGSERCSSKISSIVISVMKGTERNRARKMGLNENFFPLSLTMQATP